ncbi:GspH/FimT family pseudopilin [Nocardioides sp. GY 10127]|uniref:GspH/FimT family pseudopilin n=1 Tax=Nocardioides sp. GY 10127 TaxID=2569762 RepID=UPI0010A797AD|nr:GspH/FimT family pseudopilin [Nocardioides sp. GY 10127]TIC78908.1 prepilin-type N-terminal cleavage/methylation domain-containing protein [Nocardioides sp. GY 10127]
MPLRHPARPACRPSAAERACAGERAGDRGFTLVELLATIVVGSILTTLAIAGWVQWWRAQAQVTVAEEVRAVLRTTQQRAVTEGRSLCVQLDAHSWSLWSGRCEDAGRTLLSGPTALDDDHVELTEAAFTTADGGSLAAVTFSSRGTASPGQVVVVRDGDAVSTGTVIAVEGLTGRVSMR